MVCGPLGRGSNQAVQRFHWKVVWPCWSLEKTSQKPLAKESAPFQLRPRILASELHSTKQESVCQEEAKTSASLASQHLGATVSGRDCKPGSMCTQQFYELRVECRVFFLKWGTLFTIEDIPCVSCLKVCKPIVAGLQAKENKDNQF